MPLSGPPEKRESTIGGGLSKPVSRNRSLPKPASTPRRSNLPTNPNPGGGSSDSIRPKLPAPRNNTRKKFTGRTRSNPGPIPEYNPMPEDADYRFSRYSHKVAKYSPWYKAWREWQDKRDAAMRELSKKFYNSKAYHWQNMPARFREKYPRPPRV